ncbi:putative atpase, partial [Globisporangium splendens]
MKVVALVSGGKDSCYAMMECVRYGHDIVCLAHLHPPLELAPEDAEIDSFMYQSVGHNVVSLIAESMELPLVTQTITGTAIKQDIDYHGTTDGDEVEDLYRLLEKVLADYPEVEAVCTGAIFSSYQRNRVENVCSRLGLTSLGYLWRREQEDLLDDMVESGIEAILVKVASIGLTPRKHLGKTIEELQQDFLALQDKYQLNVCGEGGEYETLTLDCPLFKKRIVIDSSRVVLHSDDYFAPVAFLVIEKCHLEDKEPASPSKLASRLPISSFVPDLTLSAQEKPRGSDATSATTLAQTAPTGRAFLSAHRQFRNLFYLSGFMCSNSASFTLEQEIKELFDHAKDTLAKESMTLEDVCFVHLYVQDMNQFGQINAEYCKYFGTHMPPSRSCVEVGSLPARVLMDCIGIRGSGESKLRQSSRVTRDVLHIKSISAWAPNCIGPYSQANILHKSLILLAGQVSFLPQTMEIVGADHVAQAKQCYRNAGKVLESLESNLRHICSAVVYTTAMDTSGSSVADLTQVCRAQMVSNAGLKDRFEDVVDSDESDDEVDKDQERVALVTKAPLLVIQVSHLPRHALVEVELQAFCHRVLKHLGPVSSVFKLNSQIDNSGWEFECQTSIIPRAVSLIVCMATLPSPSKQALEADQVHQSALGLVKCIEKSLTNAQLPWDRVLHFRVFYQMAAFQSEVEIASALRDAITALCQHPLAADRALPAMTFVPTETIQNDALLAVQVTAHDLDKLETELWLRKQI